MFDSLCALEIGNWKIREHREELPTSPGTFPPSWLLLLLPKRCWLPKALLPLDTGSRKDGFVWIHRIAFWKTRTMLLSPKVPVRSLHFYTSQLCNLENNSSFSPSHNKFSSLCLLAPDSPERGTYQFLPRARSVICPGLNYSQEGRKTSQDCSWLKGTHQSP